MKKSKRGEVIIKSEGFVYQLGQLHSNVIESILSANEGTYGIEQLNQEIRVFVPNTERLPYKTTEIQWDFFESEQNTAAFYELQLRNPIFLPLYHKETVDLTSFPGVFTQILIRKVKSNWRDNVISQYEEYLKGNDYPSTSKLIRSVQGVVLSGLSKFSNFNMSKQPIPEAEEKILSPNFKVEVRFVVSGNDQFERSMNEQLKKLSYYNELDLVRVNDKQLPQLIKDREFQSHLNNQLSEQELRCLVGTGTPIIKREVEVNKVPPPPRQTNSSNVLDLLPLGVDSNRDIDDTVAQQLVNSFKRTKITNKQLKVNSVNRGATLQKITLTIPSDVLYTNIEKNLKNIHLSLGNDSVSMEIGDVPDTVNFYIPCHDRDVVYLRSILESEEFMEHVKSATLPLILGEDSIGNPLVSDLAELKHILIAGATGSGKSVYLSGLILTLLMYKSPSEMKMILIDPKQVEFKPFENYPHVTFISDMEDASGVFETLIEKMEIRYSLMADKGCRNVVQYNNKVKERLPYIVCIVDELSDLMDTNGSEIEDYIIRIGQKARASGIHLVLCTQKPSADVVTTRIKSNLPSAISFRLKTQSDYRTVFGQGIPFNLLGKGDGVAMIEGNKKEFVRFQAPVIDLDEEHVVDIIDEVADTYSGVEGETFEIIEKESPLDQIKRIIACTGETRISALRDEMKIRMNLVSDLVKQLVNEGWLIKEGKGYKIVADENELNNWREVTEK